MEEIRSESKFVWKFILNIILTPITLLLVLFRKKQFKDLFQPFIDLFKFIFEPKFTISIIIINIILFVISLFFFSEATLNSLMNYPADLIHLRLYTLITSGFFHASWIHLLGNMLGIFIFGRVVERRLGFFKTLLIYFGALIISNLFTSLIHLFIIGDNIGGLGASGAIMGLVSTAILLDPFYFTYELIIPLPIMVAGWLAIYADIAGIINPVEDGIGHFAHIGGFISVGLLMFLIGIDERSKLKKGFIINIISLVVAVAIYFLVVGKVV
jgi:membrane associated rhomboid family serine protease